MFLPTTPGELDELQWPALDVILVSGDTYIDSPYSGIALIGKRLLSAGYKVGVITQPAIDSPQDITRLGEPTLFWGVSAGMVDSMVANYTALGKPRRTDDNTPGGLNNRRPDRATITYTNLIRRYFKGTTPIVLGGIEASLRRVTHYDYWSDSLRRSVLIDAKADYLLYGMADNSVLELAETLKAGGDPASIRGLCYLAHTFPKNYLELPDFETVKADKAVFTRMFQTFYENNDPVSAKGLAQGYGDRYVVQNPPAPVLTTAEMDEVYDLAYENAVHPFYAALGEVRALETVRNSIVTHRGCYGECNFCAIALHEGRRVSWRSADSIVAEARKLAASPDFKGIIHDLSGPTANMYGFECKIKTTRGACPDKSCIYPVVCPALGLTHKPHLELLQRVRNVPGVRKVFIGSGIRHDMVMADSQYGETYLEELAGHHVSGQLKLAPEHSQPGVLRRMRKPGTASLLSFKRRFEKLSYQAGKEQYLTYYLIAAYPGCSDGDMLELRQFAAEHLGVIPEQVQIFTPTPSTYASLMYYTGQDPFTEEPLFVEKGIAGKMRQKETLTGWRKQKSSDNRSERSRGSQERRVNLSEKGKDEERPNRYQGSKPQHDRDEAAGKFRKPRYGDQPEETRVIRDDSGHFFKNQKPEGWVDRNKDKDERKPGSRGGGPRREGSRPEYRKSGEGSRSERPYHPRPEGTQASQGERPGYRKSGEGGRSERPYRPRPEGSQASQGERPGYRKSGEGSRSERPYRPRPEGTQASQGERPGYCKSGEGNRSERPYGPRPEGSQASQGERPGYPRRDKPDQGGAGSTRTRSGDRPYTPKPQGGKPGESKPYDKKPYGKKPYGKKPYGSASKPRSGEQASGAGRKPGSDGPRKDRRKTDG